MILIDYVKLRLRLRKAMRAGDPELHRLGELIPRGSLVMDVGANRGVYALAMSRYAGRIMAFEPFPAVARRLTHGMVPNIEIHGVALSDADGESDLSVPNHPRGGLNHPGARVGVAAEGAEECADVGWTGRVQLRTLDNYTADGPSFVKIDVEGHEERVLAGARQTLAQLKPNLLVEMEERHNPGVLQRLPVRLAEFGYRCAFLDQGAWQPLDRLDHNQRGPSGRYINNFLFTADSDLLPDQRPGVIRDGHGATQTDDQV